MISYALPMSKGAASPQPRDFADVLDYTIVRWFGNVESDFAAAAGVSGASVSRWRRRIGRPSNTKLEKMQPHIRDNRGRPVSLPWLVDITWPGQKAPTPGQYRPGKDAPKAGEAPSWLLLRHALPVELDRMLAEDSPIPDDERDTLTKLINSAMAPYRTYMRKRKTGSS